MIDRKNLNVPTIILVIALVLSIWMLILLSDVGQNLDSVEQKLIETEQRVDRIERELEIGNTIEEGGKYQW